MHGMHFAKRNDETLVTSGVLIPPAVVLAADAGTDVEPKLDFSKAQVRSPSRIIGSLHSLDSCSRVSTTISHPHVCAEGDRVGCGRAASLS